MATDLYSLGAILYELLAGNLPFRTSHTCPVLEEEPSPPSRVAAVPEISGGQLAGDLDSILLHALGKDPRQRYRSVEQFSADLERYREGRPVLARPRSRMYVLRRFVGRNRVNLALAALAVCSLIAGAVVSAWKWRAAENNLAVAERR